MGLEMTVWEFLQAHYILSTAFVVVLLLLILNELKGMGRGGQLSCQGAVDCINHQSAVVLDVRVADKFKQGHIVNAVNFPAEDLEKRVNTLNKYKSKPVIVVCEDGQASSKLAEALKHKGFGQVLVLKGGMRAWLDEQFPTTQS